MGPQPRGFWLAAILMGLPLARVSAAEPSAPTKEQADFLDQVRASTQAAPKPARASQGNLAAPNAPAAPAAAPASYQFSDGLVEGQLGAPEMRKANRAAGAIVTRRMEQSRPDDLRLLRDAAGADVVVTTGVYDRVQDVLRAVSVKHVVIPPHLLEHLPLLPTQTLMVNCPGEVSDAAVAKIRDFVKRGGYLVTTDWALRVTQRAFPGTIEHNGRTTGNDVVSVQVNDKSEPLLAHVKVMQDHPRWWLESSSYPIRIVDQKRVRVLMSSQEMAKKYGDGAVVVSFLEGQGKVLHMTSHFFLQQSKLVAKSEQQSGSTFAKGAGLADKDVAALKAQGVDVDELKAGELNSAYSMQQVSANLLVEKQRQNQRLMKERYRGTLRRDAAAPAAAPAPGVAAAPAAAAKAGKAGLKKDYRVEILEEKGNKAKVRDLFGNEAWVEKDAVAY